MFKWITKLFSKRPRLCVKKSPVVFKNNNRWGDAISINKADDYFNITGYGFAPIFFGCNFPERGDFFEVNTKSGNISVYVFTEIKRMKDPRDMFFFKATFLKYKEEECTTKE